MQAEEVGNLTRLAEVHRFHSGPERSALGQCVVSSPDDAALMEAISRRDRNAFEILYVRHYRHVNAVCLRILGGKSDAQDALIETFWDVWRKAERYDQKRGTVITYLSLLARTRAIDLYRGRASKTARICSEAANIDGMDEQIARSQRAVEKPEDVLLANEDRCRVRKALMTINPVHREAIQMAYFYGLSYREIAESLEVPLSTIKTRIRLGLNQLREFFRRGPIAGG